MIILAQVDNYIAGFKLAAEKRGHIWIWWHPNIPTFDAFDEVNPDLVFLTKEPAGSVLKCLKEKPNIQWVSTKGPIKTSTNKEFKRVCLVDHYLFFPVDPEEQYQCDIAVIGELHWKVAKLCHPVGKYKIKIAGPKPWPVVQYIGAVTADEARRLYCSSNIVIALNEEQEYEAAAMKCPFVSIDSKNFDEEIKMGIEGKFNMNVPKYYNLAIPNCTYDNMLEKMEMF
jgi:hypothetical protein